MRLDWSPILSRSELEKLLVQQCISEQHPWSTGDEHLIEGHLKTACESVVRETRAESKIEWGHYGSGYASFVDAWFYKTSPDFDVKHPIRHGEEHTGLVVLLSRLSPFFVFMEGEKHWHAKGASSYLPAFDMLDKIESKGASSLAEQVQAILERHGLVRVVREQLTEPLPPDLEVPTILADRGFTHFDALFYWED
ncbi:hypothetical protein [Polaromonas sp. JS666]|uniref:hypothetical protein n=1 Tax=Polaromonas sp. (strain JS666 / ATCC BAA-500) TaxID=296591 RepID=UPI00094554A4|nr:hypothetical protein [Polaromonas sp. JS666]